MRRFLATIFLLSIFLVAASSTTAVQIVIDYSRDTSSLFNESTTNGQQARSSLEAAADQLSFLLTDTLAPIEVPDPFVTDRGVTFTWTWQLAFNDPSTGEAARINDATFAQDEFRIYVGGSSLNGTTLGIGSPGAAAAIGGPDSFGLTSADIDQANSIEIPFFDSVNTRGKEAGYSSWGGAITLNTDRPWHRDHTTAVPSNRDDLYTTAMHEMIHVFGFGTVDEWHALRQGSSFEGATSEAIHGSSVPLFSGDNGHWAEGITSDVFRTESVQVEATQVAIMAPTLNLGERKQITELDAAGLVDIGWDIAAVAIPEPMTLTLLALGAATMTLVRSQRENG